MTGNLPKIIHSQKIRKKSFVSFFRSSLVLDNQCQDPDWHEYENHTTLYRNKDIENLRQDKTKKQKRITKKYTKRIEKKK